MEEGFLSSYDGNGEISSPDQPGDVHVTVVSTFFTSRWWAGIHRFVASPRTLPKPAQLESLREETWQELSNEFGGIANQWWPVSWANQIVRITAWMYFLVGFVSITFGVLDPSVTLSSGYMMVSSFFVLLGIACFLYYQWVVSRTKVLSNRVYQVVSKYQDVVESEGYQLEFLVHPARFRTYAVRFRPIVSEHRGGPPNERAMMPVTELTNQWGIRMESLLFVFVFLIPIYFLDKNQV